MMIGDKCWGRKLGFSGIRTVIVVGTSGCRGSELIEMSIVGICL